MFLRPSMGPPPFGDGNLAASPTSDARGYSPTFNGATAFRRWKLTAGLHAQAVLGPNLQWGHRLSAMETVQACLGRESAGGPASFNGATAFRRWKLSSYLHSRSRRYATRPSMGPPPFGDGNWQGRRLLPRYRTHLQWGHRLSAMETGDLEASISPSTGGLPSMGPPPFGDGNAWRNDSDWRRLERGLQWGHRLSAMETSGCHHQLALQWGHRLSAMETALCGSSAPWFHAKALFSRRIGYRINGHSVRDQLGFGAP